jgi:ABC-2 type transport system permease protein
MKKILIFLRKEFLQIFRNRSMALMILGLPILQLLILGNAATFEIKKLKLGIVDKDLSSVSRLLHSKLMSSDYFDVILFAFDENSAEEGLMDNSIDFYIEIPKNFESELFRENEAKPLIVINAINGSKASVAMGYLTNVIADYNREIREKYSSAIPVNIEPSAQLKSISTEYSFWYNPDMNYHFFMVPGILVMLVTIIGLFLSSMNVVREKEIGTIEQLNVTPIKKYQFIIGKLLPMWIIGLFELSFGMVVAWVIFRIPFEGSVAPVFAFSSIYLIAVCGMGLLISTLSNTQQQAMFLSWFFMVIFILLSGLFTAIENMPDWVQTITLFNPVRYFIEVIRMVILKGSGFSNLTKHFLVVSIFAVVLNILAAIRYRKTV